jgi:uncharacterized protein
LKPRGVRVTVLCPGPVETDFSVRPLGTFSRRMTRPMEYVVRHGMAGFLAGEPVVIPGKHNKALSMLPRILPRRTILSMIGASKRRSFEAS